MSTDSSCVSIASDDSRNKGKKSSKVPVKRRTRANKDECERHIDLMLIESIKCSYYSS